MGVSRAEIENWAQQTYQKKTVAVEDATKSATGIMKKLAVYVVKVGRE